jgi:nudix-type nucleoside diphosphatase (YffH/AdpP family)
MPMRFVETKALFEGWTKFLVVKLQRPDGRVVERALLDHGASACVLPYDPERRLALLVCQPRVPLLYLGNPQPLMEAIAGRVESEKPPDAARREAEEEAGLRLRELEPIAKCWSSPGVSTERFYLYLARYSSADRIGPGGGRRDELEDVTVREMPLSDLAALTDQGQLQDAKTLLLVQTLRLRSPNLFA